MQAKKCNLTQEQKDRVVKTNRALTEIFCDEYGVEAQGYTSSSSSSSLFNHGVRLGLISREERDMAKEYYDNLWDYCGD